MDNKVCKVCDCKVWIDKQCHRIELINKTCYKGVQKYRDIDDFLLQSVTGTYCIWECIDVIIKDTCVMFLSVKRNTSNCHMLIVYKNKLWSLLSYNNFANESNLCFIIKFKALSMLLRYIRKEIFAIDNTNHVITKNVFVKPINKFIVREENNATHSPPKLQVIVSYFVYNYFYFRLDIIKSKMPLCVFIAMLVDSNNINMLSKYLRKL